MLSTSCCSWKHYWGLLLRHALVRLLSYRWDFDPFHHLPNTSFSTLASPNKLTSTSLRTRRSHINQFTPSLLHVACHTVQNPRSEAPRTEALRGIKRKSESPKFWKLFPLYQFSVDCSSRVSPQNHFVSEDSEMLTLKLWRDRSTNVP